MLDRPTIDPALLARFAAIVGDKYATTDPAMQAPYLVEMRNMFQGHTPVVLRPGSVEEVSKILALATNRQADAISELATLVGLYAAKGDSRLEAARDELRNLDPDNAALGAPALWSLLPLAPKGDLAGRWEAMAATIRNVLPPPPSARMRAATALLAIGLSLIGLLLVAARHSSAQPVDPSDDSLRLYAVHVSGGLYGVYLGRGLIITAAHVVGSAHPPVRIAGVDLAGKVLKESPFEQLDLALLSVDEEKLPVSLRLRRMSLCRRPAFVGEPVIVAIPEGVAASQVVSPLLLSPNFRQRFSTLIKDVATTGNSGSGVFDESQKCLLGIMSRKFSVNLPSGGVKDIAKYFVPAPVIRGFISGE